MTTFPMTGIPRANIPEDTFETKFLHDPQLAGTYIVDNIGRVGRLIVGGTFRNEITNLAGDSAFTGPAFRVRCLVDEVRVRALYVAVIGAISDWLLPELPYIEKFDECQHAAYKLWSGYITRMSIGDCVLPDHPDLRDFVGTVLNGKCATDAERYIIEHLLFRTLEN